MLSMWGFIVKFFQLFHMLEIVYNKNIIKEKDEQISQFAKEMKRAKENPEIQRIAGWKPKQFHTLKHKSWNLKGSE